MTALVARVPLQPLHMSSTQRPPRRLSARLQEKDVSQPDQHESAREAQTAKTNAKKRKTGTVPCPSSSFTKPTNHFDSL